jgi:hypothetical protein
MDRRLRAVLLVAGVVALAVLILGRSRTPAPEPEPASPAPPDEPSLVRITPEAAPPLAPTVDPPVPFVQGAGPHPIESGRTLGIERRDLPDGTPLLLDLQVPAEVIPEEPALRVIATDGRVLETVGQSGDREGSVRLPLDPAWLSPGRYVIELRTLEREHFPLRRFAIEVR